MHVFESIIAKWDVRHTRRHSICTTTGQNEGMYVGLLPGLQILSACDCGIQFAWVDCEHTPLTFSNWHRASFNSLSELLRKPLRTDNMKSAAGACKHDSILVCSLCTKSTFTAFRLPCHAERMRQDKREIDVVQGFSNVIESHTEHIARLEFNLLRDRIGIISFL